MIQGRRAFFARRLQCQLIELATQALYSEQFDMDAIVNRLSRNRPCVALLRAYVAVQSAARLTEPLSDADVEPALDAIRLSEAHSESPVFGDILDVHRELAEHYWSRAHIAILRGKLASMNDEDSYEGTIYRLQYSNKGPVSKEERAKYELICRQIADLNCQIEDAELKAWKEQDEQEYYLYKEELEARTLSVEINAHEAEATAMECAEVVSMLEAKLNTLIHNGDQTA